MLVLLPTQCCSHTVVEESVPRCRAQQGARLVLYSGDEKENYNPKLSIYSTCNDIKMRNKKNNFSIAEVLQPSH
jgi:hypothetical protein